MAKPYKSISRAGGMPFPYGFFFIDKGWIVIPGDLTFQKFSRAFPSGGNAKKLSREELLRVLDGLTEGRTSKWVKVMEGTPESR